MVKIQTYLLNGIFFFFGGGGGGGGGGEEGGGRNTVLFILPPLESKWQSTLNSLSSTSRRQNFRPQILKNVKSKLYHIENSKSRGQTV